MSMSMACSSIRTCATHWHWGSSPQIDFLDALHGGLDGFQFQPQLMGLVDAYGLSHGLSSFLRHCWYTRRFVTGLVHRGGAHVRGGHGSPPSRRRQLHPCLRLAVLAQPLRPRPTRPPPADNSVKMPSSCRWARARRRSATCTSSAASGAARRRRASGVWRRHGQGQLPRCPLPRAPPDRGVPLAAVMAAFTVLVRPPLAAQQDAKGLRPAGQNVQLGRDGFGVEVVHDGENVGVAHMSIIAEEITDGNRRWVSHSCAIHAPVRCSCAIRAPGGSAFTTLTR